jgi:hypothetical protein
MKTEVLKTTIDSLIADGVVFSVNGDILSIEGGRSVIDQETISILKQHKQQIIKLLSDQSEPRKKRVVRRNGKTLEPGLDEPNEMKKPDMSDAPEQPQEQSVNALSQAQNPQPSTLLSLESQVKTLEERNIGIAKGEALKPDPPAEPTSKEFTEPKRPIFLNNLGNGVKGRCARSVVIEKARYARSQTLPLDCECGGTIYHLNQEGTIGQCFRCNTHYELRFPV